MRKLLSKLRFKELALFGLVQLLAFNNSLCQITVTKSAPVKEIPPEPYDSLRNFLGSEDYLQYRGQEFYVLPKAEKLREYGYEKFVKDCEVSYLDKENIYACCESYNSKYDALAGKYFRVLNVEKQKGSYSIEGKGCITLQEKETGEQIYYLYSGNSAFSFPFLVVGHFEKLKQLYADKEVLVIPWKKDGSNRPMADISTGEQFVLKSEEFVKCIDVTLNESFKPVFVLETEGGKKFMFPTYALDLNGMSRLLLKEDAIGYKLDFGEKFWQAILDEKVVVGMTEQMVRMSWGNPEKINPSSSGNQWVYTSAYLYFENGVMRSFN